MPYKDKELHRAKCKANYQAKKAEYIARASKWKEGNRDKYRKIQSKAYFKRRYRLTQDRYIELLQEAGTHCKICGREYSRKLKPCVDHCHETGKVRGIICRICNMAEGLLGGKAAVLNLLKHLNEGSAKV